ncbi:hypothetical protein TNCV_3312561 [Trichonephila clavipes]|nr:hypothetical protein TNCV_3312561 [Trichonephila clavipes]
MSSGRGSLMVMACGRHVMSSTPCAIKTCRVEELMHVKSIEAQSSPVAWCGSLGRVDLPAQISVLSLDRG